MCLTDIVKTQSDKILAFLIIVAFGCCGFNFMDNRGNYHKIEESAKDQAAKLEAVKQNLINKIETVDAKTAANEKAMVASNHKVTITLTEIQRDVMYIRQNVESQKK